MKSLMRCAASIAALVSASANPALAEPETAVEERLTAEQVRADLDAWLEWTKATHPDLSYSVAPAGLQTAAERVARDLPETLSHAQAWRKLAALNPLLNDAHLGILVPRVSHVSDDALPLTVAVSRDSLTLSASAEASDPAVEIAAFNGVPWADLYAQSMALLRGENDALRRFIIERRLHGLLRLLLPEGELTSMTIKSASGGPIVVPVDASRLRFVAPDASGYALQFEGDTAVLSIPSFARDREEEFAAFLNQAFAKITKHGSKSLRIDISQNGGGAHDLSDRLMAYLTSEPYAATSAITARITPENQALVLGSTLGDVVTVPFADPVTPPQDLANRFVGDVTIKLGAKTYSQAIVFAATAQDTGLAQLSGMVPQAPANQTGQVQTFTLPNTGFTVRAPIYIIFRASGDKGRDPLKLDISG